MKDYLNIGSSPPDEDCVQVGSTCYTQRAQIECDKYIEALRKKLGDEPEGAWLQVRTFSHDFGNYAEVVCNYDTDIPESFEYALKCEGEGPLTWAEVGMTKPEFYAIIGR
jgi:hypothetical protein